jgi:sulfite reductase (NADPH) hemoprotein beta-component
VRLHDIGLNAVFDYDGRPGFTVVVGGASGRTPIIGHVLREFLPAAHLLTHLDAILRVCNRQGRRDDKRKARITMLLKETGVVDFRRQVEHAWSLLEGGPGTLPPSEIARIGARRVARPVHPHRMRGYAAVTMSLNRTGVRSGDISSACAGR